MRKVKLAVFSDASYANLHDGGSQGGFVIFLMDDQSHCCPIAWASRRIKRVVKSTLAAETLSLVDASEMAVLLSYSIGSMLFNRNCLIPIVSYTDNKSLFEAVHSTTSILDKRLRVDIAILREMVERKEMTVEWIEASKQLSDSLTKRGASSAALLEVFKSGTFWW